MSPLLSAAARLLNDHADGWIIFTATLPPVLYLLYKKKKPGWLQKLLLKKRKLNWFQLVLLRRAQRRKKIDDDEKAVRIFVGLIIAFFLIGAVVAFIKGSTATGIIALVIGLVIAGALAKRKSSAR
jgi:hypothetical protein